jgi:peptidoglycan/xylan/chitin deacetylase (PgdA/CDA1 family)
VLILCYHGISTLDEHQWSDLFVTPAFFARRVALLKRLRYSVMDLPSAIDALQAGELPEKSVVITFDDGFADFYQYAVPIATAHGVPLTVYLTTYYAEHQFPVFNLMLSYLLWRGRDATCALPSLGKAEPVSLANGTTRKALVRQTVRRASPEQITNEEKNQICADVANALGIDYAELGRLRLLQLMTPAEVSALASTQGVDVQLHTHRHRLPSEKPRLLAEVEENRKWIQRVAGLEADHFCYPSGNYRPEMLPWLREAGVRSATTCDHGLAARNSEMLLLPRFLDSESVSEVEFEGWLSGLAELIPHRRVYAAGF